MATDPIGSFSGLASGIQWRDMVDQIMQLEESRTLTPLSREISAAQARAEAWKSYGTLAGKLADAAKALRDGTAFQGFRLNVGNSPTTSRTLLTASASSAAAPGSYRVEVQQLAAAEKLGGAYASDPTAALGASGWLRVNGRAVEVLATDSLNAVRDKINAVNSGSSASKVTASVLTVAGRSRLVLASDATGAAGIELGEVRASTGGASLLDALGFADSGTPSLNLAADGSVQSARLSTVSGTIMAALGVTVSPPPATLVVNGKSVTVPEGATVSDVVALINAQSPGAARTEAEADGASYRLKITGSVAAGDAGGTALLEALGMTERGRTASTQRVTTANALSASGAPATEATALSALGATTGDTFTITGTTTAGAPVNTTFTVGGASTLGDLTAAIRTAYGSATVDVSVDANGRIVVADKNAGDSLLAFTITQGVAGGTGIDFGGTTVAETGRKRQLVAGADAQIKVDDALLLRASNTITDAIGGVTLDLKQAEAGTTIAVDVARDVDGGVKAVQDFAKALNDLTAFAAKETAADGRLAYNGALRASVASMKNLLLTDVAGLPAGAPYGRGALVGVAFSKTGTLEVDATALKSALTSNLADVQRLFGTGATSTDSRLQYQWAGSTTVAGRYTVDVTQAATASAATGTLSGWTYSASGSGDKLEITDAASGTKATLDLASGDTVDAVVTKLNALFATQKMRITASSEGGALKLAHQEYGSVPGFTVAYLGDAAGAEAQVGLASGTYHGVDAAGTITGGDPASTVALTGKGQLLTAPAGFAADGLVLKYGGIAPQAAITVDFALGLGGVVSRAAESIDATDGFVASQTGTIDTTVARLQQRSDDVQSRLDARRQAMIRQFTAMEAALSKITAQGTWLASQVKALQSSND